MDITAIAGAGISAGFDRIGSVATTVAGGAVDLPDAIVELSSAKLQTEANIAVLKAARDVERHTLDLFA